MDINEFFLFTVVANECIHFIYW